MDIRGQIKPAEHLTPGHELRWHVWKTFNRLRMGVGRSKITSRNGDDQDASCYCDALQTMARLLIFPMAPGPCTQAKLTLIYLAGYLKGPTESHGRGPVLSS